MILECPECSSRFRVPDSAFENGGRRVRCGACSHIWFAEAHNLADTDLIQPASADRDDPGTMYQPDAPPSDEDQMEAGQESQSHILSSIAATVEQGIDADDMPDASGFGHAPGSTEPVGSPDIPQDAERDGLGRELGETMERLRTDEAVYGSAGVPAISYRPNRLVLFGWVLWIVFVAGIVGAFFLMQDTLMRVWPPIGQVYEMAGMGGQGATAPDHMPPPIPTADEALFVQIDGEPDWLADDQGWTLQVDGTVSNETNMDYTLPPLHLLLLGADGTILKSTAVVLDRRSLAPREKIRFSVRIDNAPAETTGIVHEWQKRSKN